MAEEQKTITEEQKQQSLAKFEEYIGRAASYYNQRAAALFEEYHLKELGVQSIGCDLSKGVLTFKKDGQAVLSFSAQPLFFWNEAEGSILWSWADGRVGGALSEEMLRLKELYAYTDWDSFLSDTAETSAETVMGLIALCMYHLGALAMFPLELDGGTMFLALTKKLS